MIGFSEVAMTRISTSSAAGLGAGTSSDVRAAELVDPLASIE